MKRREFITGLGLAALVWSTPARAEPRRIGILFGGFSETDPEAGARIEAFKLQLEELGWVSSRRIRTDVRFGGGDTARVRAYAQELIDLTPDVLVANSAPAVFALAERTKVIPIVFSNFFDPVESGLVVSLDRPGGNITGFSNFQPSITGKWLQLLKEIAPTVSRVTAMYDRDSPDNAQYMQMAEKLAPSLNFQYVAAPVSTGVEIQEAIDKSARSPNSGLVVMGGTITSANRQAIVQLVGQRQLPTVYAFRYYVSNGGLLSYGVDGLDLFRRTATYVDRILKGAKPADLPVQTPTKFELVINLKTAKVENLPLLNNRICGAFL